MTPEEERQLRVAVWSLHLDLMRHEAERRLALQQRKHRRSIAAVVGLVLTAFMLGHCTR